MKYKVGDKVKVVEKFGSIWVDGSMDKTVGLKGEVIEISIHRGIPRIRLQLSDNIPRWWYLEESLELINRITFKFIYET